ncbi:DgyrCDS10259 [Dimorphilus gyrociliatus]|uniref:DgyrCDS10259 n=1 Tax=Dimorphilus gyrociliatus TaxID=2664684 RepID=A0A7I8W287_9ANNE|nr:DgyrCDS10259 [Dimorphilus gyrociliatus]
MEFPAKSNVKHWIQTLNDIREYKEYIKAGSLEIDGETLTISKLYAMTFKPSFECSITEKCCDKMKKNYEFFTDLLKSGKVVYGANTGYGGSANVRYESVAKVQEYLVSHLKAGFGRKAPTELIRGVMVQRANSLSKARSAVREEVPLLLLEMVRKDIVPIVPLRGTVSASGDLMPSSYIAAAMMNMKGSRVLHKGVEMEASEAFQLASVKPVEFHAKEALAVVNSSSFAASLGSCMLFEANVCAILVQICTALIAESLEGHLESFHSLLHESMPHPGQLECAANLSSLLNNSKMSITDLEMRREDSKGLKQDRYALRTSPQWVAPVLDTLLRSREKLEIELNSSNDNPLIDDERGVVIHGGNFQGISVSMGLDHARQAIQLCGKLLHGQFQELVNGSMNGNLTPNLCGSDYNVDMGFKGCDTAMAAYCSELDGLANPVTNHVLSAELHNQAINSMGFLSARKLEESIEVLKQMIVQSLVATCQAIDLRYLKNYAEAIIKTILNEHKLNEKTFYRVCPWWVLVFSPPEAEVRLKEISPFMNGLRFKDFLSEFEEVAKPVLESIKNGTLVDRISDELGYGTKKVYRFLRQELNIKFNIGANSLDKDMEKVLSCINSQKILDLLQEIELYS